MRQFQPGEGVLYQSAGASQLDAIRQGFFPLEFDFVSDGDQFDYVRVADQPGWDIAEVCGRAHTALLSDARSRMMKGRHIKVLWQIEGAAHLQQCSRSSTISAGRWTVYDASAPYVMDMSDGSAFLTLVFDSEQDVNWGRLADAMHGAASPTSGAALVAMNAVRSVLSIDGALTGRECAALKDSLFALLSAHVTDRPIDRSASVLEDIVADATAFIMRNLTSPELNVLRVAAAMRVSRRTIYNAFAAIGETPQKFILNARLDRCHQILSDDKAGRKFPITRLAFDSGFNDSAYFSRAFRQRYGMSPSQMLRRV